MSGIRGRIKKLLDVKDITPSQLADSINANRSRLSHILTGRNNPSLEIVQSILEVFPEISPDWMLSGKGSMLRTGQELMDGAEHKLKATNPDLFSYLNKGDEEKFDSEAFQNSSKRLHSLENESNKTDETVVSKDDLKMNIDKENIQSPDRKSRVKMIMIYYNNNEYETFLPDK